MLMALMKAPAENLARTLNEVPGLENPTAEQLCVWLYNRIKPLLPPLAAITVAETCTTEAEYRP